jgi:hypothetical protein
MELMFLNKIEGFQCLKAGWCYGEGLPFDTTMLNDAKQIAIALLKSGFSQIDAFPGLSGEIRVTAYHKNDYFEFTLEERNSVTYLYETAGVENEYEETLNLAECFSIIKRLGKICASYELYIKSTMTPSLDVSKVLPFDLRQVMEAFQFSNITAQSQPVARFATTSRTSIPTSAGNHPYIGSSMPMLCQKTMTSKHRQVTEMMPAIVT